MYLSFRCCGHMIVLMNKPTIIKRYENSIRLGCYISMLIRYNRMIFIRNLVFFAIQRLLNKYEIGCFSSTKSRRFRFATMDHMLLYSKYSSILMIRLTKGILLCFQSLTGWEYCTIIPPHHSILFHPTHHMTLKLSISTKNAIQAQISVRRDDLHDEVCINPFMLNRHE